MAGTLLLKPDNEPSSEAAHIALFFANIAWNESTGIARDRESYRSGWEIIEAENPEVWKEFKSNDINAMIDDLVACKKKHFPNDKRRILTCGMPDGKNVRIEWMPPAAPDVDAEWELSLYGLVRMGQREKAIQFLQKTRKMSRREASIQVNIVAGRLGL